MGAVEDARDAILRTFRWTEGHADFGLVFRDPTALSEVGPALAAPFVGAGVTAVVGLEARGFVLGALCAEHLGVGLVLARKPGSIHPGPKVEVVSAADWRGRKIPIRIARVLSSADRVLLVDDWIETGSQARAVKQAVEAMGAVFAGTAVIVDDTVEQTRAELNVVALVTSAELGPSTRPS
ncbi:MAG: adenine phosphoribosyltransferase [Actinomycetota bacterium]